MCVMLQFAHAQSGDRQSDKAGDQQWQRDHAPHDKGESPGDAPVNAE
jgi:hypothetical protein